MIKKTSLSLLVLMFAYTAQADVIVNIDRDLQLLAINGEELTGSFGHTPQVTLGDGINQLVFRAEKVIHMGGNKNKYKSPAIVVKIVANNSQLLVQPSINIRDETMSKEFDRNPGVTVISQQGKVEYTQDVLLSRGMGLFRDYEKELVRFNQSNSVAAVSLREQSVQNMPHGTEGYQYNVETSKVEQLKVHFSQLKLSDEEKKAFLSWAVSQ